MLVYLYHLEEPDTNKIRYVGKTINPKTRLSAHKRDAHSGSRRIKKNVWLQDLFTERGLYPTMIIISQATDNTWKDEEQRLIFEYQLAGHDLTNMTKGGDMSTTFSGPSHYNYGKHISTKTKQKLSIKAKQRWQAGIYEIHRQPNVIRFGIEGAKNHRTAMQEYNANKIISTESRNKMSAHQSRPIILVNVDNIICGEYPNAQVAAKALGCKRSNVNGRRRSGGLLLDKYRVYFKDEHEDNRHSLF